MESSSKEESKNLSEILFKPKRTFIETSLISNSGCPLPDIDFSIRRNGFGPNWYRPIMRLYWAWSGGNPLDIDEVLAKICVANGKRSREGLFDTIIDYGPGNWIYEFSIRGQERIERAKQAIAEGNNKQAGHHYRMASRYFSIAATPNLKGDDLAYEAATLSRNAYRLMIENEGSLHYEYLGFNVEGHTVHAHLHTPDKKQPYPCVILLSTYEQSSTDFFRLFYDELRPNGIGLIIVDMPGMNSSIKLQLNVESSVILDCLIDHLRERVPYIDHTAIGIAGFQIGGTLAMRYAILNQGKIKALGLVNPAVHDIYCNQNLLNELTLCERSSIANRMGFDASSWSTVVPQLQLLSLKKQGLISVSAKSSTPAFVGFLGREKFLNKDVHMAANAFKSSTLQVYKDSDFSQGFKVCLFDLSKFFIEKLVR